MKAKRVNNDTVTSLGKIVSPDEVYAAAAPPTVDTENYSSKINTKPSQIDCPGI